MKVIQLSYGHLSDQLKPCFWYLASYSKDKDIMISELKNLWSDEGLLEPTDLKSVEEVMEVYVDEFISSSVITVRGGREERCQIHDLVHDFCSIKSRKEKLFDLMSSTIPSSSSSSSDPMLRGMTIHYDEDLHTNEFPFLSNPEKKNPCAKHLLSLKIHLKYEFWHTCALLVHLRCLIIPTVVEAEALPPSFSNLCNLETLKVINWASNMVLSRTIWNLAKLRHVDTHCCSVFNSDIGKPTKLENLISLKFLYLSYSVDSADIFKRFPNLRTLEFIMEFSEAEQIYFPRLDLLNKLETIHTYFESSKDTHVHQFAFHFPSSLEEVKLCVSFNLTSDALSGIGRSLPNLQKLRLCTSSIEGRKEWNIDQVITDESFPVLEELYIKCCDKIIEIPESFGDIASLKLIKVYGSPQLKESALKIKEYVEEMTGEDKLEVEIGS
ncbi:hypothetical protein P3L10_016091 [Capsicum annuum]